MGEGYRICLHGPFQAAGPDGPVEFQARSAAALVAYCSLRRGPVPRSEAASELWPDADPEVARTNLRTALHRVKKAAPDLLASEGEFLMLQGCTSDIDEADQRHRQFLLAPNDPSAIGALADEWEIRKRPLLDGWTDEWAELARLAADYAAQDVARELARAAEATDDDRLALATWTEVHTRMPSELEAIKNVLRLEAELNGRTKALAKAEQIERTLQTDAPPQLRNLLASLRTGVLEAVPKPELLRTRSEILLLARMFESNLKENREEALTLLLTECRKEGARHPKTAFSLVQLALSETTGASEVRVRLAMLASSLGSWVGEYHSAHHWADFAREHLPKTSAEYVEMLGNHGFMYLEQRQHTLAESCLREALAICDTHGFIRESLSTRVRLAGVLLHTMRFEEASAMYEETLKDGEAHQVPNLPAVRAATSYNTCLVRCMTATGGRRRNLAKPAWIRRTTCRCISGWRSVRTGCPSIAWAMFKGASGP
jgi:DNA-binding SARP family transcriptional activator